ncbi:HupE/UreJ family protein [Marinomonas sp. A79]|uniref:HupE/UreJ family protein n=1 Tax=Marinomonas vulgaris TaxID=2823372 RepID=A0ABS5HBB8_9GAMM|nr:HupE/UreJ family protein [Marinomonas vulgaris]MBR7888742.1 HupE/UreJ family protein [Marinomonas vulgaris]
MRSVTLKMGIAATMVALPTLVMAHPGHEHASSFMTGLMHPMGGLDHLLAMLAVGLWAASIGGKAMWMLPLAFISAMLLGGGLAIAGIQMPFVEQGILLSVILVGVLLVASARFSIATCASIAGLFALFHGTAHGVEMPLNANGVEYALGFIAATFALHITGMALGTLVTRLQAPLMTRLAGSVIAIAGVILAIA